jgi:hypothetical protein
MAQESKRGRFRPHAATTLLTHLGHVCVTYVLHKPTFMSFSLWSIIVVSPYAAIKSGRLDLKRRTKSTQLLTAIALATSAKAGALQMRCEAVAQVVPAWHYLTPICNG